MQVCHDAQLHQLDACLLLERHLRLLDEAGLQERTREGANTWFSLPPSDTPAGSLARLLTGRIPEDDAALLAARRQAARRFF